MQKNSAKEIAKEFIGSMKSVFGRGVEGISLHDVSDVPFQQFSVNFVLYDYFPMQFNYDRGRFGCCICFGERAIPIKTSFEWNDGNIYDEYWKEIAYEIKLRIPDKYLAAKGWM